MYHQFYQLTENPFNVTADPDFFYPSQSHAEAISNLIYGVDQRKGILVIIGEVGTGKTMVCRTLLNKMGKKLKFSSIINPNFTEIELLKVIVRDLRIWTREQNKYGLMRVLHKYLSRQAKKGHPIVLLIDEAQNLSVNQLEQIRLLSNLETNKQKLLQIILVGQPELDEKLNLTELRQLRQRIAVYLHLQPLIKADVRSYIEHRINKVVYQPEMNRQIIFTDQALDAIYNVTQGTPRKINILCDRALLSGYVSETYLIDDIIVQNCAKEVLYYEHHI